MQIAFVLMGCILGFAGALYAFAVLGAGFFASVAIWGASGPVSILMLAGIHAMRSPRPMRDTQRQPEIA